MKHFLIRDCLVCPFAKQNKKNNTFKCQKIKKSKELNIDSLNNNIRDDCPLNDAYSYNNGYIKDVMIIDCQNNPKFCTYKIGIDFHNTRMTEKYTIDLENTRDEIKDQLLSHQKKFFKLVYNFSNDLFDENKIDEWLTKLNEIYKKFKY